MEFKKINLNQIKIDKEQPRQQFDEERLKELSQSIKEVGQLQPVIVKKKSEKEYFLIAGERRFKAVQADGEKEAISAAVIEEDVNVRQIQLVENLQREDLNPLERAKSIQEFIEDNDLTKKAASEKLGVPRTTLTEWLNILEVKPHYQEAVIDPDSSLTLSHISLAKGLAHRTGDPSKLNNLLAGVIKYNFTRNETKEIVDLFYDYLHLSMEEAFATILMKRGRQDLDQKIKREKKKENYRGSVKKLINTFNRMSENLEEFMEVTGDIDSEEDRENIIDEFLYIYQLLELVVPEIKKKSIEQLKKEIKQGYIED